MAKTDQGQALSLLSVIPAALPRGTAAETRLETRRLDLGPACATGATARKHDPDQAKVEARMSIPVSAREAKWVGE
ncbi:hypothetical protein F4810DRAFT_707018 [Camillea tinctor]|nr:hypothetical protein F4810DRAFT_707018 [Camillea tinctor]